MEAAASGEDFAASTARTSYSEELLKGIDGAPMNTDTERHLVRGLGNQDLLIKQLNGPELEDAPSELFRDSKNSTQPAHPSQVPFLLRFPVTFYGVVIGSTSQGIVWLNISRSPIFWGDWNGSARTIQWCVWAFGVVMLFAISVVYALKIIYWWGAVLRELHHPFRIHFFFGPLLGIMNLCNGAPYDILDRSAEPPERPPLPLVAIVMTATLIVETFVYREWIFSDGLSIRNNNPGYQLSLLPNFSGAVLLANAELESIGHFFWSVGVLFWLLLFISLFQSISKEAPRDADGRRTDIWRFPSTAHPTLFLFIAAPAAAGSSWTALSDHGFDDTSLFFASIALFIAMFMTTNLRLLVQTPFTISWWTYTSTIGSLSVVYTRYAESRPDQDFLRYFSFALSLFSSFMVLLVLVKTLTRLFSIDWTIDPKTNKVKNPGLFPIDPVIEICLTKVSKKMRVRRRHKHKHGNGRSSKHQNTSAESKVVEESKQVQRDVTGTSFYLRRPSSSMSNRQSSMTLTCAP